MARGVVVVGAGAVDLGSAIELAARGARVTVVERSLLGGATAVTESARRHENDRCGG